MRKLAIPILILIAGVLAACQGIPPTVVVVVTSTVDPNVVQITVTPSTPVAQVATSGPATQSANSVAQSSTNPPAASVTPAPPKATSAPTMTPTFFPTQTRVQLNIAQEDFEHGFMFWIEAKKVIWVLHATSPTTGTWESFPDTFVDGEPETDPSLVPPSDKFFQPKRGFGKIWRMPGMKDQLGWATTPEYALTTNYVYQPIGHVDNNGKFISEPGTHFITSLARDVFALTQSAEGDKGTWVRNPQNPGS